MSRIDWPPTEGLLAFTRKHGLTEAASRLGVGRSTLRSHLNEQGLTAKDYRPARTLNDDALKEIADLIG